MNSDGRSELGLAIRVARIAVNISQYRLSAQVGMHVSTLNAVERGRTIPSAELANSLLSELARNAPRSSFVSAVLSDARKAIEQSATR